MGFLKIDHILWCQVTSQSFNLIIWIRSNLIWARSREPRQGWITAPYSIMWDGIIYPCLRYLALAQRYSYHLKPLMIWLTNSCCLKMLSYLKYKNRQSQVHITFSFYISFNKSTKLRWTEHATLGIIDLRTKPLSENGIRHRKYHWSMTCITIIMKNGWNRKERLFKNNHFETWLFTHRHNGKKILILVHGSQIHPCSVMGLNTFKFLSKCLLTSIHVP